LVEDGTLTTIISEFLIGVFCHFSGHGKFDYHHHNIKDEVAGIGAQADDEVTNGAQ
jgi:hypothetical protein